MKMRRFRWIVLDVLFVLPMVAQAEELCMEGTLLFREDFGGNEPSDPAIGRTAVSGMSSGYTQIYKLQTSDPGAGMGAGCYLVAKRGFRNSTRSDYSVWHIMDDHTHFGDTTRGYLLEIDGRGSGNDVFYSTVINDLCAGSRLTFSAYVANLTTAGQYNAWRSRNYVHPKLSFVLTHPETGAELARYNTDTIAHDWNNYPKSWRETADWQLVGMNFTVPEGVNAVRLSIRNNASGSSTGNDFAMDDIEIRLCAPPVTIDGEAEVCENTATSLSADFTNDGTFAETLEYKWWHSDDSVTWTELIEITGVLSISATQKNDSGWYKVAVAGIGNIGNINCRAESTPFRLKVKECAPPEPEPELCTDGILLFREDFGGNSPDDPRVGQDPVQGMTYTQLLTDTWRSMGSGKYLLTKSGYCNGDTSLTNLPQNRSSQWHLQDDHTYPNDRTRGYLLEIDGRGDNAAFYTTTIGGLCEGIELTFSAYVANVMTWGMYVGSPGRYTYPRLKFVLTNPSSNATLATYDTGEIPFDSAFIGDYKCWQESSKWNLVGMNFVVPIGVEAIQLSIYNNTTGYTGNDFAIDDIEIHLCMTPDTVRKDTIVCDTLQSVQWRGKAFMMADTLRDTLRSSCGFDSIYYVMKVGTEVCCPDLHYATRDTTVCDTLMPFTWHGMLFEESGSQTTIEKDDRGCDTLQTTWTLVTKVCCPDLHYATRDTTVCDTLMPFTWHGLLFEESGSQTTIEKDERGCDTLQTTWTLSTKVCCPELHYATRDTTVCDTLMPFTWHGLLFEESGSQTTIEKDERGCDTLQTTWTLGTKVCCPDLHYATRDTTVCDTLMPFIWMIEGYEVTFSDIGTEYLSVPHPRWTNCIASEYTLRLDTFHCERLYLLIVNKYNWQLLLDNVSFARFFPGRTARAYQWYKNDAPILGATDDDYAEQNELQGRFQLRIELDGGQAVWSNILEIGEVQTETEQPVHVRIYDSHGVPVWEEQVTRGVYLYRYEQGDKKWTEKRLIL